LIFQFSSFRALSRWSEAVAIASEVAAISAVELLGPEAPKETAPDFKAFAAACRSAVDARTWLADAILKPSSELADIFLSAKFFPELLSTSERGAHQKSKEI
jgi:hypothetical protein